MSVDFRRYQRDLERIAIDPTSSFLSGGPTSMFSTTGSAVTVGRIENPFIKPINALPDAAAIAQDIISDIIVDVTEFAASYAGQKVGELLVPPSLSDITAVAVSYLGWAIQSPGDILKYLMSEAEKEVDNSDIESLKETLANLNQQINTGLGGMQRKLAYILENTLPEWTSYIGTYIYQGPKWVISKAEYIDRMAKEEVEKLIHNSTKHLFDLREQNINDKAKGWAMRQAENINKKVRDETIDKLHKVMELKARALNIAAAAVKKALLAMMAALGL